MKTYATEIAIAIFLSSVCLSYGVGRHNGYEQSQQEITVQIAKDNESARKTEQELNNKISDLSIQLIKVQDDAKKQIAKRDSDIATGKLQLFIKTKSPVCPSTNAPVTSGSDTATAQLDPAFAQSIVSITDDGDSAIRKLNACVAVYNQVRTMINGFPNPR